MKTNPSNSNILSELGLEIRSQAIAALTNLAINGAEYWNLTKSTPGSANFHAAWNYATGSGVTIGLVDEGVNYTHLDLTENYDASIDFDPRDDIAAFDAHPDSSAEDHGTEVAGVIAGSAANDFGTIGAAPGATITASYLRYGSSFTLTEIGAILAHQSAYDVSNNSWGFLAAFSDNFERSYFAPVSEGMEQAATLGRGGLGTAMVFAAGNSKLMLEGENVGDDSNFHNLSNSRFGIAVGAHDAEGRAAVFSSPGTNVLISAPGVGLLTTGGSSAGATSSTYVSGTSFAAPMVASAIALMLEANPNLGYRDIQEILAISADPTLGPNAVTNGAGNVNGGGLVFDREVGFGNLNALAAVSLARNWTTQSTAANEEHLSADFSLPLTADPSNQSLSVDVLPGGTGFSLDHVSLTLDLDDADLADLRIELVSAAGTTALIAPNLAAAGGRTTLDFTFDSVATWGESPFGTWTVRLLHPTASGSFVINQARLDLYGDAINTDDIHYFTASFAALLAAQPSRGAISDLDGGYNTLNFAAAAGRVSVDLRAASGHIEGVAFTLAGIFAKVVGSIHDDRLVGSDAADHLIGDFGNDTLVGGEGADTIVGGPGSDVAGFVHAVSLDFSTGIHGGEAAGDVYSSIETFALSEDADSFTGGSAGETVMADGGNDAIEGRQGSDWLDGGAGADTMVGGKGDDTLTGGRSADTLSGGSGRDHFVFTRAGDSMGRAADLIKDFQHGKDRIDVSVIDANGKSTGNGKFHFIGESDFSDSRGELAIDHRAKSTIVLADIDGDGRADLQIVLAGHHQLTASDFVL